MVRIEKVEGIDIHWEMKEGLEPWKDCDRRVTTTTTTINTTKKKYHCFLSFGINSFVSWSTMGSSDGTVETSVVES